MDTSHDIGREFGSLKEKADFPESGLFLTQKLKRLKDRPFPRKFSHLGLYSDVLTEHKTLT